MRSDVVCMYMCVCNDACSDAVVPDGDAHAEPDYHGEHHAALSTYPAGAHQAGPRHLSRQEEGVSCV